MGKLIVFLLGAAAIAYGAYRFITYSADSTIAANTANGANAPQVERPLENVRQKAKEFEREGQQHADEAGKEPAP